MSQKEVHEKIESAKKARQSILSLSGNYARRECIRQLPPNIGDLTSLQKLDLSENHLEFLPKEIGQLTSLIELNLNKNNLDQLPAEIGQLTSLRKLDVSHNRLTSIPREIGQLENLTELLVYHNNLSELPSEVKNLLNLKKLHLGQEPRKYVTHTIPGLWGYHNQAIYETEKERNKFRVFPQPITSLTQLTDLKLGHVGLTSLPTTIQLLAKLKSLDLRSNKIEKLPEEISQLTKLEKLLIDDNPLVAPPIEVSTQGIEAIRRWFESEDKVGLLEAKMVLVGNGGVGKTTIRKNLLDPSYGANPNEKITHGIEIDSLQIEIALTKNSTINFKLNIWDFGGQGKYRPVQHFFCSRNSLYLFVTEPKDNIVRQHDVYVGFDYWLTFVNALGYDSDTNSKSPVIYITNKTTEGQNSFLDEQKLHQRFSQIKHFVRINCKRLSKNLLIDF